MPYYSFYPGPDYRRQATKASGLVHLWDMNSNDGMGMYWTACGMRVAGIDGCDPAGSHHVCEECQEKAAITSLEDSARAS